MAGSAERQALKRAALLALVESRSAMGGEILRVRTGWNPRELVRQSVVKHKIALAVAAGIAGLLVARVFIFPSRERAAGASMRSRLAGLAASTLWSFFQEPVLDFAKAHFTSYLGRHHQSTDPNKPE